MAPQDQVILHPRAPDVRDACFFDAFRHALPANLARTLQIGLVGDPAAMILTGSLVRPPTHVILLHTRRQASGARNLRDALHGAGVAARTRLLPDGSYFGALREVSLLVHEARIEYAAIQLNVGGGPPALACALTTASFLYGLPAFCIEEGRLVPLPVMPFDQRGLLGDEKVAILRALQASPRSGCTRRGLVRAGLPRAGLARHLGGEPGRKGLLGLGLVEESRGPGLPRRFRLSAAGEALLAGGVVASPPTTV